MSEAATDPFESLVRSMAFASKDWSIDSRDAWVYGIICGWDEALDEICVQHGWSQEAKDRLRKLNKVFEDQAFRYREI